MNITEDQYREGLDRHAKAISELVDTLQAEHGLNPGEAVVQALGAQLAQVTFDLERLTKAHNILVTQVGAMGATSSRALARIPDKPKRGLFRRIFRL